MALSKSYTFKDIRGIIQLWVKKELGDELEPEFIKTLTNLSVLEVVESLSPVIMPDYGKTADITPSSNNQGTYPGTSAIIDVDEIDSTGHGLAVGDRLVYYTASKIAVGYVETVPDSDTFTVSEAIGDPTNPETVHYVKLSGSELDTADISSYNIDEIVRINCSVNGDVLKLKENDFTIYKNLALKQSGVYYYRHGNTLYFYRGSSASNWGTVTMFYYGYPTAVSSDSDYIDLRDKYIPLLINVLKAKIYEHLQQIPPESLTNAISAKIANELGTEVNKDEAIAKKTGGG